MKELQKHQRMGKESVKSELQCQYRIHSELWEKEKKKLIKKFDKNKTTEKEMVEPKLQLLLGYSFILCRYIDTNVFFWHFFPSRGQQILAIRFKCNPFFYFILENNFRSIYVCFVLKHFSSVNL